MAVGDSVARGHGPSALSSDRVAAEHPAIAAEQLAPPLADHDAL